MIELFEIIREFGNGHFSLNGLLFFLLFIRPEIEGHDDRYNQESRHHRQSDLDSARLTGFLNFRHESLV